VPLLPLPNCDLPEPPEDACPWLWETAQAILAAALVGLDPYIPVADSGECEDPFSTYVSMSAPVAERYDALSVYLVRLGPDAQSKALKANLPGCGDGLFPNEQAEWVVELWENGYPTARKLDNDVIVVPSPAELAAVNRWLYAHGNGVYQALTSAQAQGITGLPAVIDKVIIGDMVPLGPQGQAAGWRIPVTTVAG
jgi:hypothetical protein